MFTRICRAFLAAALVTIPLFASEQPWSGAPLTGDPKALLAAAESVPAGDAAAVVLLDERRYTFDDAGHSTRSERLIFRVVDQSAVDDWSTVEAEWAPWYEEKPVIAARVIAKSGAVSVLDAKAVTEAPSRDESLDVFSDNRIFRAPLPGVAAGSVVEEVITWKDHNPLFDTGTSGQMQFGRFAPVQETRLVIDAPSSLAIRFVNKTAPLIAPKKDEKDGRQQIVYETGRLEALENLEWNLPYDESPIPFVAFSTGQSWQELARRYGEIVEKQIAAGSVQPFVKETIGASTDRREIVARALAAIEKNVRYAGVEVGEGSIVPRAPAQVLSLKYGDCKDKATLLVAMLRAAGLTANVGLLRAGTGLDVHADLPSLSGFNHVIVRVEGEQPMWVDPTDEFSPAGTLSIQDQDRLVLIAGAGTTALVRTPAADSSANHAVETRVFTLSDEGKSEVVEVGEDVGSGDAARRRYAAETDKKTYREAMESYVKDEYSAEKLKSVETNDPRDLSKPFKLTLTATNAARGTTGDVDAAVAIFPQNLLLMVPYAMRNVPADDDKDDTAKKPKKRVHDFVFTNPYVKEWRYRVVPPPGFVARTLPANETKPIGTMMLTTQYSALPDGAVEAVIRFDSGKRRITAAEYEETRKGIAAIAKTPAVFIGFDSIGWAKLTAGDVGAALTEFRRLAALHPKEARHHVQIARAYLGGGMAEAARAEIRRAIAMEPGYAPAQRVLGIILQHDLLSREFRKGFDLDGAIAAYRKAKELAPKDDDIRGELAKLLERGSDGMLFGSGAHLGEAIAEYNALIIERKEDRFEGELVMAMARAGKFAELKTRARDIKDPQQKMLAMVIAAAATDGVDAALREANSADPTTRRQILGVATQTMMSLRLYPQAAALLEQSVQGTPNASQTRSILEILRHTSRIEDLKLPPNQPKTLVVTVMFAALHPGFVEDDFKKYLASFINDFEADAKAKRKETKRERERPNSLEAMRRKTLDGNLPEEVIADLGMAALDLLQEGSDATGYRIRVRARAGLPATTPQETYYIVRDNDRYAIAATRSSAGAIGAAVLHFLAKNELENARLWLNWAREDIPAAGGDDPLYGPTFPALWAKSKATATADEIRAAAASLVASDPDYVAVAIPLLAAVRETVTVEQRPWIDITLSYCHAASDDAASSLAAAQRALAVYPDSAVAFSTAALALIESGNAAEVQKLAKVRLDKSPKDDVALRALSELALHGGDFETASKYLRQIIDESTATSSDYNNVAWYELFIGKTIDRAIEDARQATILPGGGSGSLHTLAALYAESGKSLEARTELLKSMDEAGKDEPSSVDWYVLGRIAENFGAADAAIADYKRVDKPARVMAGSTYDLAQRRLAAMKK